MRSLRILTLLMLVGACSTRPDRVELLQPEIALRQMPMSQFLLQYPGPISVGFQMLVRNPSGEPITLRRLQLTTVGTGSYYLRNLPNVFHQVIQPDEAVVVSFSVQAVAQGGRTGSREPVIIRGIAYFESSTGSFHKIFTQHVLPTGGD